MKKEIVPEFLWHLDKVIFTFQTTIITTVDARGRVNAAPFGLVYPFSTGSDNPQMLVGINSQWHTAQNILETKEFVINYPPRRLLEQVTATGLFFPEGVSELEKTGLDEMPSLQVKPPRINDCYQHIILAIENDFSCAGAQPGLFHSCRKPLSTLTIMGQTTCPRQKSGMQGGC